MVLMECANVKKLKKKKTQLLRVVHHIHSLGKNNKKNAGMNYGNTNCAVLVSCV